MELIVLEQSELVVKAIGFEGEEEFNASKPDETLRIYKKTINITFYIGLNKKCQIDCVYSGANI